MSFVAILDTQLDPDAPLTSQLAYQWRDNPTATAEGSSGAPYVAAGWHPFDGVNVGDGNSGKIYDFTVSGAVASVVSPDFTDGFEYMFVCKELSSALATTGFNIELYRETTGSYASAFVAIPYAAALSQNLYSRTEVLFPRSVSRAFIMNSYSVESTSNATVTPISNSGAVAVVTPQKILRARISFTSANINSGVIHMYRRRSWL